MASAGRILIMPKGNYDSSVTYEMLDLVYYNGASWLAKKTSVGIVPSEANSEYWQSILGFDPSNKANGGTVQFTANPNGNDYIIHTFNVKHTGNTVYFANIAGSTTLCVIGVSITNYQPNSVEVKIFLNQQYDGDVVFVAGYMY